MHVRVLLFGMLKDLTGKSCDIVDVREGSSVRDLLAQYAARYPTLSPALSSIAVAVNQQYAAADTVLNASDEVALLPPVSGGAPDSTATNTEIGELETRPHARIVRSPIDAHQTLSILKRPEDGAAVLFEGVVRNQTRGRRTLFLDYEAYEEMALQQLEALASEALQKFPIRDIQIIHRLGRLEIGETSVLIAVASAHRGPAFDACRWIIDTLKRTVPIWKKEHFEDGAVWADGEPFPSEIPRANS